MIRVMLPLPLHRAGGIREPWSCFRSPAVMVFPSGYACVTLFNTFPGTQSQNEPRKDSE
jgi:hypothetical protein